MSIELHCPGCGKLIRAPEDAGGRRGKCPHCKRSVYIPTALTDDDIIPLAPVDPAEEERDERMRRESSAYAASLSKAGEGASAPKRPRPGGPPPGHVVDVSAEVTSYIRAMHKSKLEEAERIAKVLGSVASKAKDHIQGMMVDELPPSIEGVPPPLVQGFLKSLLSRL